MTAALTIKTTVLPGPKIEIDTPSLKAGEAVEVTVVPLPAETERRESVLDMIKRMPPGRLFKTAKEVDEYLNQERDFVGSLTLPIGHDVYVDANILIYSVEQINGYWPLLRPLWAASNAHSIRVVTSELSILETLTGPIKRGDAALVSSYEQVLLSGEIALVPIDRELLRMAAQLCASVRLRTPDAIHAATSISSGCSVFLTNDGAFRDVAELHTVVLQDMLGS